MKKLIALILILLAIIACEQEPDPQEEPLEANAHLTAEGQGFYSDTLLLRVTFQGTGTACIRWMQGRRDSQDPFTIRHEEYWNVNPDIDPTSNIFTASRTLGIAKYGDRPYQMYVEVYRVVLDLNDTIFTLLATSNTITGRVHHSY